jgi:type VI secretion system secreted protein Hcp
MAIYLKFGDIKGDVTTDGWKDWILLESCQFGAGRGIGSAKNTGANREGSEPSLSEIVVSKSWDAKSSSKIFEESVSGPLDRKVEIHFSTTSDKKQEAFLIVKLKDAGISSYSVSSGGDKPSESLSINYGHIEIVPKIIGTGLKAEDGTKVSFDMKVMKANV